MECGVRHDRDFNASKNLVPAGLISVAQNAKVIAHEGRHRARALHARGVIQMPVILNSVCVGDKGPAIRWGSYNVDKMPTVLRGESSGQIPMPQSVIFPPK
jgi:hypothetical protein